MLNIAELLKEKKGEIENNAELFKKVTTSNIDDLLLVDTPKLKNNALHVALDLSLFRVAKLLIAKFKEAGKLHVTNELGETPLLSAILSGSTELALLISEEFTNDQLCDSSGKVGRSPICFAIYHDKPEVALAFAKRLSYQELVGKSINREGDTILKFASKKKKTALVQELEKIIADKKPAQKEQLESEVLFTEGLANDEREFYLNTLFVALSGLRKENWHHEPLKAWLATAVPILVNDKGFKGLDIRFDDLRSDATCNVWIKKIEEAKAKTAAIPIEH